MNDWTAGYVTDITYTYGYYPELNPLRARLPLLYAGIVPSDVVAACELGFGQGMSINLHAAASAVEWYGTDFNPAQAGFARELAVAAGSGAKLYDDAFADFAHRTDLPDFDYIRVTRDLELDFGRQPPHHRRLYPAQAQSGRRALHQLQHPARLGGDGAAA